MGTLLRCLLCRPCCPCCELRPPCPCCPHCWPPSGLQLRQRLSFCLSDHPWSCPCCHPRHRRGLCWCRPLRRQLRWNRPCCQEGGWAEPYYYGGYHGLGYRGLGYG